MPTRGRSDKFPLTLHPTGQWCKKRRGRTYYFGNDRAEALKRFANEWDDILAGRPPRPRVGDLAVADLCNRFLTEKRNRVDAGELSEGTWGEYYHACSRVVEAFGRDRPVGDLRPEDFGRLRAAAAKRLGPVALSKFVTLVRTVFAHAYKAELIDAPVRFGGGFDKPPRRVMRLERARKGPKLIGADDARKLVDAADPPMRAMILLGLNGGMGATDCANLTRRALAARPGWAEYPRAKTGVPRRFPLWPETVAAIQAACAVRPDPKDPSDAECVFLTRSGNRWVRFKGRDGTRGVALDAVTQRFKKLADRLNLAVPGGFYVLRHTFRTVADEARDGPAADLVMGHADPSMAGRYRERIADERLRRVVDHVRAWLAAGPSAAIPTGVQ